MRWMRCFWSTICPQFCAIYNNMSIPISLRFVEFMLHFIRWVLYWVARGDADFSLLSLRINPGENKKKPEEGTDLCEFTTISWILFKQKCYFPQQTHFHVVIFLRTSKHLIWSKSSIMKLFAHLVMQTRYNQYREYFCILLFNWNLKCFRIGNI